MKGENCKYWNKLKNENDLGKCCRLSTMLGCEYPDVGNSGIESTPACSHDGIGVYYETKNWFGCIHFKRDGVLLSEWLETADCSNELWKILASKVFSDINIYLADISFNDNIILQEVGKRHFAEFKTLIVK